jgi:hypothetical protein
LASAGPLYSNGVIAVDDENVYWVAEGQTIQNSLVMRVARAGGAAVTLTPGWPSALVSDGVDVYWTELNDAVAADGGGNIGSIKRVPIGGGNVMTLASSEHPRCLAVDGASVYWTDTESATVMKVAKTGGVITTLAVGQTNPSAIAIDVANVYWISSSAMKVSKDGGEALTVLDAAPGAIVFGCRSLAINGDTIFLPESNRIVSALVTGATTPVVLASASEPYALVVDSTNVFWLGVAGQTQIDEVALSGGQVTTLAAPVANSVPDLAAANDGTLYWTTNTQVQSAKP